jgi:hypothetical protein
VTAIVNPFNGPGSAPNADYTRAINDLRAAGGQVLGYVYTCYGRNQCTAGLPPQRSVADVLGDVQRYASWYTLDGIFLDEMSSDDSDLGFYTEVAQSLRAGHAGWRIVGNPGNGPAAGYLAVADTLVTYEGDGSYAQAVVQPWMLGAPPATQAHLVHGVPDAAGMRAVLAQATARGAGAVFITDDLLRPNPWDTLPTYWAEEVQAVSAVPEPTSGALLGLALVLMARKGRQPRRVSICSRTAAPRSITASA